MMKHFLSILFLATGFALVQGCSSNASTAAQPGPVNEKPVKVGITDTLAEKEVIKKAAIAFYKWHENVWESAAINRKYQQLISQLVLDKTGKPTPDVEEPDCPC